MSEWNTRAGDGGRLKAVLDHFNVDAPHGSRKLVCPFHGDVNASLSIDWSKGLWHCFGCGRGGDWLSWIMEETGGSFKDAKRYAATTGIDSGGTSGEGRLLPAAGRWGQNVSAGAGSQRRNMRSRATRLRW